MNNNYYGLNDDAPVLDFSKIRVGMQSVSDATLNLGDFKKANHRLGDKKEILRAIHDADYETMRDISNFFYKTSGIYARLCRYLAYLYRYDWIVTPYINDEKVSDKKILDGFNKVLNYLDNFEVKQFFGETALKVIRNGSYYGYFVPQADRMMIQELPPRYCRTRLSVAGNRPVVEFNMKFFDDYFKDTAQKMQMLKLFPPEFKKGYILYKEGKLLPMFAGDAPSWYILDPEKTVRFALNGNEFPPLISVIPAIVDLDAAKDLDRRKMAQKLLKIIVQQLPLDKNGDLIFDVDEARELHNNAVQMLGKAIGVDVLTTFADVQVADMADKNNTNSVDELAKVERTVFNESGMTQNLFNTDGNLSTDKSITNDEAMIYNLLLQFESFLNDIITQFNKSPKKLQYRVQILTTTIYNYKELSKLYKEQTQLGYSKMLPQIALGQSQSSILANAYFENDILSLSEVFIPPMQSSVMNAEALEQSRKKNKQAAGANAPQSSETQTGRPQKEESELSDKTIQNKESMS